MKCGLCNKVVNSSTYVNGMDICEDCLYHITGELPVENTRIWTDDIIEIWIDAKTGKPNTVWVDGGNRKIPEVIFKDKSVIELILFLREHWIFCSSCGKELKEEEIEHKHFAGIYCEGCAKAYKEKHSRRCLTCGQPMHSCCC